MSDTNQNKQLLFSIGLARKAGKMSVGTDAVCDEIRKKNIQIVLCANDVSDNTRKKISDCCAYHQIRLHFCELTKYELGHAIGKPYAACIGITDENLSELISRNLLRKE